MPEFRLKGEPALLRDGVGLHRLAAVPLQRERGAIEHERGEASSECLPDEIDTRAVVEVERDGDAGPGDERPGGGGGDLYPTQVIEVRRVELEEYPGPLRLRGVDDASDHLDIRDVEAGNRVVAAFRSREEFVSTAEGHPGDSFRASEQRMAASGVAIAGNRNGGACYARPAPGGEPHTALCGTNRHMTSSATPTPSHGSDDILDALVERARAGELQAFNALVARFQDGIFSLTYRMLGSSQAAEDATQEAFIKAWQRIDTFRGGSFRSWVFTIAANQARDELRRRARRPARSLDEARDDPDRPDLDPPGDEPSPEDEAERREMRIALEQALMTLPDDWRELVVLSDIHGLDYKEIAETTGLALGTVKSRLSRARGRLREVIMESRELSEAVERLGVRR